MNAIVDPEGEHWTQRRSLTRDSGPPFRTPWEHDYARVVHSASFRRLQAKTQIIGIGENDFFRTRLTHSLEVSQIGEAISNRLYRSLDEGCPKRSWLPRPMLIRTICLAHDLGHPPFGHGGEVALNRCMLSKGGFEGNGQTLRIITSLEKYDKEHGMDLTRRAVLGTIKYPAPYSRLVNEDAYPKERQDLSGESVFKAAKFKPPKCYLNEEHDDVVLGWVAKGLEDWSRFSEVPPSWSPENGKQKHRKTNHKSLDASIMDVADDIAYGVHDLEDGIALKLIDMRDFEEWFSKCDRQEKLNPLLVDKRLGPEIHDLANKLFSRNTYERKQAIGHVVGLFVGAVEIKEEAKFQHPLFQYRTALNCGMKNALDVLKGIVTELVTKSPQVQQLEFKGQKIVTELFHAFVTDPERLLEPDHYKRIIQSEGDDDVATARVVCDYIAGMTDDYATKRYRQLFVPRAGSVFDRL